MLQFDSLGFETGYTCVIHPDLPGSGRPEPLYFGPGESTGERSGLLVGVAPIDAAPWQGYFAWGSGRIDAALGCPNPDHLCVVARGSARVVSTYSARLVATVWEETITRYHAAPEAGLLLLAGFTELCAVGSSGVVWTTVGLASDDVSIEGQADGVAWVRVYLYGRYVRRGVRMADGAVVETE